MTEKVNKHKNVHEYLHSKGVSLSPRTYFVDAMSAMALGLFASLLMGTILEKVALLDALSFVGIIARYAKAATGAIIGIAIANALKAPTLVMLASGVVGLCGNDMTTLITAGDGAARSVSAGPAGAFLCVLLACEIGKLVSGETKVDIIVTPAVTLTVGLAVAMLVCPAVAYAMYWIGYFIDYATTIMPFFMGIVISVVVGIILTLPISSAAVCSMIGITGIAGGAAVAGCCAQMVGFAVASFRENKWGGVVAQGIGTSMLQMGNIVKKPIVWLPAIFAAAVTGPVSTCIFKLECTGVSAGMGTCGFVGPIGVFTDMSFTSTSVFGVLTVCIILPAVLSFVFSEIMRKLGYIEFGDLKLDL